MDCFGLIIIILISVIVIYVISITFIITAFFQLVFCNKLIYNNEFTQTA